MRPIRHLAAAAATAAMLGTGASAAWAQTEDLEGDGLAAVTEELATWRVVVEKRWERVDGEWLGGPPLEIGADWAITVSSDLETVTCTTGLGGLACNDGGDGVSVSAGGSYTVSESGVPAGFAPHSGVGTFPTTAEAPGGACVPVDAGSPLCTHTVVNRAMSETVPGDPEAPYPDPVEEPADPPADDEVADPSGTGTPTIADLSATSDALAEPAPADASPATTAAPILPVTGGSPDALLAMGTALVATGFGAVAGSRRRNR